MAVTGPGGQNQHVAGRERDFGPAVAAWERALEWPMAVLAVIFLFAYSFDVLDTHLTSNLHRACRIADYVIWLVFAVEFAIRLMLARRRWNYLHRHFLDVLVVALPVLRPLRLLRLVMLLRVLHRRAAGTLRGRVAYYVISSTLVLIYCAALAILDAERGKPGANIETLGQALWWSVTTVSTVGYGDYYPVTTEGRFVAVGLMIGGVALIGAVAASMSSWLLDQLREVEVEAEAATRRDIEALRGQLDRIEARLQPSDPAE